VQLLSHKSGKCCKRAYVLSTSLFVSTSALVNKDQHSTNSESSTALSR